MAIRIVREYGDEILKKKSKPVEVVDDKIKELIQDMKETMHKSNGLGLAAPQVGILKRILVIDLYEEDFECLALVNPVILKQQGTQVVDEGCLSFPNQFGKVERPEKITVKALNEDGENIKIEATGLLAQAICHEVDHLEGELFIDKILPGTWEVIKPEEAEKTRRKGGKVMRIVFMGTPDFAKESLEALYDAGHEITLVITAPDKPKDRGMRLAESPVKEYAISKNLSLEQPEKIRENNEIIEKIKQTKPDIICVVAYGKILPGEILEIAPKGTVNVHGSLLPKYRGAAPIQWAVLNGEKKTGITTMFLNEEMDEGDMLLKEEVEIGEDETAGELWQRLSKVGAKLLVKTLDLLEKGKITPIPQPEGATYAPKISKEMAKIDWESKTAGEIKNLIRGLSPLMGANTNLNGNKIKFWKVDVVSYEKFIAKFKEFEDFSERIKKVEPGTVMLAHSKQGLYIKTKDAIVSVIEIQGENARRMSINEYLRGNTIGAMQMFE